MGFYDSNSYVNSQRNFSENNCSTNANNIWYKSEEIASNTNNSHNINTLNRFYGQTSHSELPCKNGCLSATPWWLSYWCRKESTLGADTALYVTHVLYVDAEEVTTTIMTKSDVTNLQTVGVRVYAIPPQRQPQYLSLGVDMKVQIRLQYGKILFA